MKRVRDALRRAERDLRELERQFALAGGLAVSVRAEPRTTRDVDFVVRVRDDEDAERLVADLTARGYVIVTAIEQSAVGRLATVRLQTEKGAVVDLLFASSGVEPEIVARAEILRVLRDVSLAVPVTGHLIAMKILSRDDRERPQDRVDISALLKCATPEDLNDARDALSLMTERGFNRGIDLLAALEQACRELGAPEV